MELAHSEKSLSNLIAVVHRGYRVDIQEVEPGSISTTPMYSVMVYKGGTSTNYRGPLESVLQAAYNQAVREERKTA